MVGTRTDGYYAYVSCGTIRYLSVDASSQPFSRQNTVSRVFSIRYGVVREHLHWRQGVVRARVINTPMPNLFDCDLPVFQKSFINAPHFIILRSARCTLLLNKTGSEQKQSEPFHSVNCYRSSQFVFFRKPQDFIKFSLA